MIFKHKKLSESAVMKELEKVAVAKGMVKVIEEPVITKEASASYTPSNNLFNDMLKLANGLRERGFTKDADSLEEKVVFYKLAETHLYRAIDEDAEDMLEFAHPKKNKIQFEAANGDGEVEDLLSQHKKIIDIVNKQPKKVAFEVLAETADILGLKKNAQVGENTSELVSNVNFLKNQLFKIIPQHGALYGSSLSSSHVLAIGVGATMWPLVEGIPGNYFTPHEKDDFEIKFLEFYRRANAINAMQWQYSFTNPDADFRDFTNKDFVNHANSNLEQLYAQFKEKLNSLPEITESSDAATVNKFIETVSSLIDKNSWFVLKGLTNNDGELENKIRLTFIKQLITNAQALYKILAAKQPVGGTGMDKILDPGFANIIAGRFESVSNKDNNSEYFKHVASVIRANGGKPYKDLYTQLVQIDKDLASAVDESKLDLIGQEWQKGYKVASNSNNLIKEALTPGEVFKTPSRTPATVPAVYHPSVNKGRAATREVSTFEKAFSKEFDAVSTMQNSLQLLADNLDKFGIKSTDMTKIRNILLGTGGVQGTYNGRVDGIWGEKTETALKEANAILAAHGEKEKLTTDAQRVDGKLQGNESDEVAALANANVGVFNKVLDAVGVNVNKDKSKPADDENSPYLDSLPVGTNLLQTDPPIEEDKVNGIPLTSEDLGSFSNLFQFIRANRLLDTSAGGFNSQTWENVLDWFYTRARKQASLLKTKAKAKYFVIVQNLFKRLPPADKDGSKIFSPSALDGAKASGPTQHADYKTNPDAEGAEAEANVNKVEPPPFGYEFNIINLYNKYGHSMEYFDQYKNWLSIPLFNVNDFSYHPTQIAAKYIKALTPEDILKLNGINNANTLIPGQTTTKYTYLDLMNSNIPAAVSLRNRANDYALISVVNGLSRDLPAIMSAYIQTSPSDRYNKIIANAWDKWAANLSSTRSRINSDFTQGGQTPRVIF